MGVQEWSAKDIEKVRNFFIHGYSIKEIAKEIGRTITATNKALSRFGIRVRKNRKNYTSPRSRAMLNLEMPIIAPSFERQALREEIDNWISFWQMCEFLSNQSVGIFEISPAGTPLEKRQFRVNTQILTPGQLLLLANKIRVENNQKAFLVRDLSW